MILSASHLRPISWLQLGKSIRVSSRNGRFAGDSKRCTAHHLSEKTPWCCSSLAFGGCPDRSMLSPNNQTIPVRVTLGAKKTPDASLHLENLPLKKRWRIKIYEISTPISNSFYNLRRKISFKMWRTQPGGISKLLAPPWWSWTLDTTTPKAPKKKYSQAPTNYGI